MTGNQQQYGVFDAPTDDISPLLLASVRGEVEIARLLIKNGANIISLHAPAKLGQISIVRPLLSHGADANEALDLTGETPLHWVSRGDGDWVDIAQL